MSNVWGEIQCKIETNSGEVELSHTILEPNFFVPQKIVHESKISEKGKRTYSKNARYSDFLLIEYLYKYEDPNSKAEELLNLEDEIILFTPGSIMWSKYCIVTIVDIYGLDSPYNRDIALIKLVSTDFAILGGYLTTLAGLNIKTKDDKKIRKNIRGIL